MRASSRAGDSRLKIVPALILCSADVVASHPPPTRANLIRQSSKFLGERYG